MERLIAHCLLCRATPGLREAPRLSAAGAGPSCRCPAQPDPGPEQPGWAAPRARQPAPGPRDESWEQTFAKISQSLGPSLS